MELNNSYPTRRRSAGIGGFTLIEVLIALIIMSVGMLGIAGLYVRSLQAGSTSTFRHHAVTLAGDIADRIRANPRAGATYALAGQNNSCVTGGVNCTRDELAANDVFLWSQQATTTLPNGAVAVVFNDGVAPPTYQITITWSQPSSFPGELFSYSITIPVFPI